MANQTLSIRRNTIYFTGALALQKAISFLYFWLISSKLAPGMLGQYIFALSFTTLFSIIADFGLSPVLIRESSKDQEGSDRYLKNILGIKIPFVLVSLLAIFLITNLTSRPQDVKELIYLASLVMIFDSFSLAFYSALRAKQNLKYESIGSIFYNLITLILGGLVLYLSLGVNFLMLALAIGSFLYLLFGIFIARFKYKLDIIPSFHFEIIKKLLKIVPAFAFAGIFVKIYNSADSVLLGFLDSEKAVGFYSIPFKVILALQHIIPGAFAATIFPAMSNYFVASKELLQKTFEKSMHYLLVVSIPMSFGILVLAREVISLVWPQYKESILAFQIMGFAIPWIFLAFPTGSLLNATNNERVTTLNRVIITILSIVLNIILISRFSFLGAAATFLATNTLLFILDIYRVSRVLDFKKAIMIGYFFKSLAAALIMAVIIFYLRNLLHILILIPLGTLVYFVLLFLFKGISREDIRIKL